LFSPVSSISETDVHDIAEILLKVVHNPNYNNVFHLITASDYHGLLGNTSFHGKQTAVDLMAQPTYE
jgi:hypothetical protein